MATSPVWVPRLWRLGLGLRATSRLHEPRHDEVLLGAGIAACAAGGLWELALSLLCPVGGRKVPPKSPEVCGKIHIYIYIYILEV